jgi:NNP family nitrate/nitrite transporter-like MFS transporter
MREQLAILRDRRVWKYCQYYSIVFGGFTALSVWMPQYYVNEYGLSIAQASLLAACFSLPGGVLRAMGGWLSGRFGAHSFIWWVLWVAWVSLFLLSYPQTEFMVHTTGGPATFYLGLPVWTATGLLFVLGIAFACGMPSTFKYISDDFPGSMGIVSGIVGLAGGMGGFLLPIWLRINPSCFMLLYRITWVSLILLYVTEVRRMPLIGSARTTGDRGRVVCGQRQPAGGRAQGFLRARPSWRRSGACIWWWIPQATRCASSWSRPASSW